ncbi:Grasp65 [Carabus blaptoides fortunei]
MGAANSVEIPGGGTEGYHVLRVQDNSPGHKAGLEAFFDFVVAIDGTRLDQDNETLKEVLKNGIDKVLNMTVYSSKTQTVRTVNITPSENWGGQGLLGVSIRFCSFEGANENVWHVLEVHPSSPAELAGLRSFTDYIIGADSILHESEDLFTLIESHEGRCLKLYVYNTVDDSCREVAITPNLSWGGNGSLGCGIGYGYLHRIPIRSTSITKIPAVPTSHVTMPLTYSTSVNTPINSTPTPTNTPVSINTPTTVPLVDIAATTAMPVISNIMAPVVTSNVPIQTTTNNVNTGFINAESLINSEVQNLPTDVASAPPITSSTIQHSAQINQPVFNPTLMNTNIKTFAPIPFSGYTTQPNTNPYSMSSITHALPTNPSMPTYPSTTNLMFDPALAAKSANELLGKTSEVLSSGGQVNAFMYNASHPVSDAQTAQTQFVPAVQPVPMMQPPAVTNSNNPTLYTTVNNS